jgi:ribosomal protein L37AE/L43A
MTTTELHVSRPMDSVWTCLLCGKTFESQREANTHEFSDIRSWLPNW